MLKIALIIGSTRPNRFADQPVQWLVESASERSDLQLDVLDLRDFNLPFFDEGISPYMTNGQYSRPEANSWRHKVGGYDGYIATVAEYNHGPTGVFKNAFDSAYVEWRRKPIGFVGYGGVGGARAIEQLRTIAVELQMTPLKHEVNIGMEPYMAVANKQKKLDDYEFLNASRNDLFDNLVWWGNALKAARNKPVLVA